MPSKTTFIMLHGCRQTNPEFEGYCKNLRRILKPLAADFLFVEAQYDYPDKGKMWFPTPLPIPVRLEDVNYSPEYVSDSLQKIHEVVAAHEGDNIVLLGFSQGGCAVDAYLAYEYPKHYTDQGPVKAAVIVSGYCLVDQARAPLNVPLLNVYGRADTIVSPDIRPTERQYTTITEISHDGGHVIPASAQCREMLAALQGLLVS